ncbi:MAG: hypothetical protein Q8K89_03795 [Actinomycetota bacterium]|nr:hypothetical protein [Actinomycetota bacterium]
MSLLIVFNNYFHDLATGVFFGCAVTMWALARSLRADPSRAEALAPAYAALTRALWIAVAWILIGGIPRTIYFPAYEFIPALGKGIVPALVVKHVFMFAAVGTGIAAWLAARRQFAPNAAADSSGS